MTYYLVFLAIAAVLGVTVLRRVLWWLTVVLPLTAYTSWMVWHDSVFVWGMVATLVLVALMGNQTVRENTRRADAGLAPLSRADLRARMWGKGPKPL